MYLSTTRLVLPVCKLGSLPVCLSTTRLIANMFICKKAFTSSVFFYNKACTASVSTRLTASVYLQKGLYCQCVHSAHCQCVYLLQGLLPMCLSTTRLIANVFICKKAFTSSVFFYNKACTASVLTRLTASVFIYKKVCTANVYTRLTASVFIYYKAYCQCVYLLQGLLPMCLSAIRRLLPVCFSTTRLVLPMC